MSNIVSPSADPDAGVVEVTEGDGKAKAIEGRSPRELVWMRLKRDKTTMVMIGVVVVVLFLAVLAPILQRMGVLDAYSFNQDLLDPNQGQAPAGAWGGISGSHWLGVEPATGRDLLSRLVLGVTFSLMVASFATLVAIVIGTVVGIVAGYSRGALDFWLSRFIDLTLTFPQTLMLLALSAPVIAILQDLLNAAPDSNIPPGIYIVLVLGLFGWPNFARIIRGQVLSLREREFVEAAKSLGARNRRIYFKELLPNLWAPVLVYVSLLLPTFISAEAALSFLGVGIRVPTPTLGNILTTAVPWAASDPLFFLVPAVTIAGLVLCFNLLGDGLRDALDPKADRT